jgi:hypothetical protein
VAWPVGRGKSRRCVAGRLRARIRLDSGFFVKKRPVSQITGEISHKSDEETTLIGYGGAENPGIKSIRRENLSSPLLRLNALSDRTERSWRENMMGQSLHYQPKSRQIALKHEICWLNR